MTSETASNVKGAPVGLSSGLVVELLNVARPAETIGGPRKSADTARGWISRWIARRDSAIAFLRARGLLATVIDRDAEILHYRLTGKRYHYTAEDLVELAQAMGFEASDAH